MKQFTFVESYLKKSRHIIVLIIIAIISIIITNNYDILILLGILFIYLILSFYFFHPKSIKLENYILFKDNNEINLRDFRSIIISKPVVGYTNITGYYVFECEKESIVLFENVYKRSIKEIYKIIISILENSDIGFENDLEYAFEKEYDEISKRTSGNLLISIFFFIVCLGCAILIMVYGSLFESLFFLLLSIGWFALGIHILRFKRSKLNYQFNLVSYVNILTLIILMNGIWIIIYGLLSYYFK